MERVERLCRELGISIAHAEDMIRGMDNFQVVRCGQLDERIRKAFKDNGPAGVILACKTVRELTECGLMMAKRYVDEVKKGVNLYPEDEVM